jgi:hypothetical protein
MFQDYNLNQKAAGSNDNNKADQKHLAAFVKLMNDHFNLNQKGSSTKNNNIEEEWSNLAGDHRSSTKNNTEEECSNNNNKADQKHLAGEQCSPTM